MQIVLDVIERLVEDLIAVRQTVNFLRGQVDEHVVLELRVECVRIRVRVASSSLEILAAHETRVYVAICERDRAQLLEIEIQRTPVDRVEVGADDVTVCVALQASEVRRRRVALQRIRIILRTGAVRLQLDGLALLLHGRILLLLHRDGR